MKKDSIRRDKTGIKKQFSILLLKWNTEQNKRQMPWKGEKDPYKIWLSEIILQQTRVEQGLNYYNRFIEKFPDIHRLANANDSLVFKLWEGLGYYTRCRNLLATARYISNELGGKFPSTYEGIKALKGIGPYTAAAISSFAFNLPHAVLDGNVFRVLSRVFGIDRPIDSTEGKKYFTVLAEELLEKKQPGKYNQAIMDFGAIICKPVSPICSACIFRKKCVAYMEDGIATLPVKQKKIRIKKRWFYYLVLEHEKLMAIQRRTSKDIWNQLHEFSMIEKPGEEPVESVLKEAEKSGLLSKNNYEVVATSTTYKQQLSHQLIAGKFIKITLKKKLSSNEKLIWVKASQLKKFAFPRLINQYLDNSKQQSLF